MEVAWAGMGVRRGPTREKHLPYIGDIIPISVLEKKSFGGLMNDHPTVGKDQRCWNRQLFRKESRFVRLAVVVGVFKDPNAITALTDGAFLVGIVDRFNNPKPTPFVPVHAHDLSLDHGFTGEKFAFKLDGRGQVLHREERFDWFLHFA